MEKNAREAEASILVVEDDFDVQDALVPILEHEGHRVVRAANGRDALEQLRAMPTPALILLDLAMPIMDGAAFRAAQLQDPQLASIPVVVLSADPEAKQKAARFGAAGCIEKPIDVDHLLHEVKRTARPTDSAARPSGVRSVAASVREP